MDFTNEQKERKGTHISFHHSVELQSDNLQLPHLTQHIVCHVDRKMCRHQLNSQYCKCLFILITFIIIIAFYTVVYLPSHIINACGKFTHKVPRSHFGDLLDFLPYGERNCTVLMENKDKWLNSTSPTQDYYNTVRSHSKEMEQIKKTLNPENIEGYSGQLQEEIMVYWKLASLSFVKTVCETGFNAGHSTLVWLSAKADTHIYSFDLGEHEYAKPMAHFVNQTFPGRFTITWGDSTKTLRKFRQEHPDIKCDLAIIDGGHTTVAANADFDNFRQMVNKENIVVLDDYPSGKTNFQTELGAVWERKKRMYQLLEIFQCSYGANSMRGFSIGHILP